MGGWAMTDVFISYSRGDRERVRVIADALTARGLKVWWDPEITTGAEFRFEITQELDASRAVVVVWSSNSVSSRFVCDEADVGAQRESLIPVLLELVDIPLGFRQIQTADLSRWRGRKKDPAFREFLDVVEDMVRATPKRKRAAKPKGKAAQPMGPSEGAPPAPEPAPAPVADTRQVEEAAPRRKKKRRRGKSHMTTGRHMRVALIWRSIVLTALVSGIFGGLAYISDFVFDAYRPALIGTLAALVFISRYSTFQADRASGAASMRLMPRSYLALLFFSMIALSPLLLEGRMYAAALQAVRMQGIEGADINGISFDTTGTLVATASDDSTARVWDAETGVQLSVYRHHEHWVWNAAFSPDGTQLVSASRDLTAQVWDRTSAEQSVVLTGHKSSVYDAAFSPKGDVIATASTDKTIRLWDASSGDTLAVMGGHSDRVTALEFDRQGDLLASSSADGTVRLWRTRDGAAMGTLRAGQPLHDVTFNAAGTLLAATGESGRVSVWNLRSRRTVANFKAPGKLFAVRFAGNGNLLATGGIDGILRIWNIETGALQSELLGHESAIRALDISPDGSKLASASRDNTARIWDVTSGDQIQIMGHITPAINFPFVLDAPPIITASRAPIPIDISADREKTIELAGKGIALALIALVAGVLLKGILWVVRLRKLSRWTVVAATGLPALYIAALMLSALPIHATLLWITLAFVPAAVFALLRWMTTRAIVGRGR